MSDTASTATHPAPETPESSGASQPAVAVAPRRSRGARVALALAVVVAVVLMGLFFAAFKFSGWGVAMRASAEDTEAAALMGIRLG
ncbi:MAG: braD, partial [Marmoricola sp.]|nr:braD [Marmoricola sp.]